MTRQQRPYGNWNSPITAEQIAQGNIRLSEPRWGAGDEPTVYWLEGRPLERGRSVIVVQEGNASPRDGIPAGMSAHTKVNEYGGGNFVVGASGGIFFSEGSDQRIYHIIPGQEAIAVTPEGPWRYADLVEDRHRQRLICVREDHSAEGREPVTTLVAVRLGAAGEEVPEPVSVLVEGHDFYSSPRISPDGTRLCWLSWDHPNMPWDGTELWVADLDAEGRLIDRRRVAGGPNESIFQPEWSPRGQLHFVSDRTGWWNHYRVGADGNVDWQWRQDADFGLPQWVFGMSAYGILSDGRLLCTWLEEGISRLGLLDPERQQLQPIATPLTEIEDLQVRGDQALLIGASQTDLPAVLQLDLTTHSCSVLRRSGEWALDPADVSIPEAIEFPTDGGLTAHGFFYRPAHRSVEGPPGERPPLLVMSHGGPTSATSTGLRPTIQYWTTRGIAVLDVNYGGSTGYGRAYRDRLKGRWGIVDVADCVNGARYLVERGWVDGERMAIRGGSAGGYTTLCALTFTDHFRAGASYYGVSDLAILEVDTHKFESRYTHSLVAPYPERADLYAERSPLQHVDRLQTPVIFFQGLDDKVVPPNQATLMVEALRSKGIPVEYVAYPGEGHGFRQAMTIRDALERELAFYGRVLGFDPVP